MRKRTWLRTAVQVASIGAIGFTARASFADHYVVPSGSMEPTVQIGDRIVVNKMAYGLRIPLTDRYVANFEMPSRGDVVVLEADQPTVLLKRVVAISGDWVEVRDGHVYIDGQETIEPTIQMMPELGGASGGPDFGPTRVPKNKLLVLGDNRGNSRDGRFFGFVDRDHVLGHAVAVVGRDGKPTYVGL